MVCRSRQVTEGVNNTVYIYELILAPWYIFCACKEIEDRLKAFCGEMVSYPVGFISTMLSDTLLMSLWISADSATE